MVTRESLREVLGDLLYFIRFRYLSDGENLEDPFGLIDPGFMEEFKIFHGRKEKETILGAEEETNKDSSETQKNLDEVKKAEESSLPPSDAHDGNSKVE